MRWRPPNRRLPRAAQCDRIDGWIPPEQLRHLVNGYQVSQALHVAATLGISDALASGPRDVDDLAQATSTHAPDPARG